MIDKQDELERVQDAYDIEKEELDDLRERFTKLSGMQSFYFVFIPV